MLTDLILKFIDNIFAKAMAENIGVTAELHTRNALEKLPDEYLVINNLMIKTKDNRTHQIDHVVISKYGIFVIETKCYNYPIIGNEIARNWKSNYRYYIKNPLYQNYGHIKALEEVLNLNKKYFINIVNILGDGKIMVESNSLTRTNYLVEKITSYQKILLPNYKSIYVKLRSLNITDIRERKNHARYIEYIKNYNEVHDFNECPLCGGKLVKRSGKYGDFIGCSNYPRCIYTKNLKE